MAKNRKRKGMDDVRPPADKRWDEDLVWINVENTWMKIRLIDEPFPFGRHWIKVKANEEPEQGKRAKVYPRECTNFNPESESPDADHGCPACEHDIGWQRCYLFNCIDREAQENGARNPVRAFQMTPGLLDKIIKLKGLNVQKGADGTKQTFHVNHAKCGCDLMVRYDGSKVGDAKWEVQLSTDPDDKGPLSKRDMSYDLFDFEEIYPDFEDEITCDEYNRSTRASMKRGGHFDEDEEDIGSMNRSKQMGSPDDDDDDDDDEPEEPRVETAKAPDKPKQMESKVDIDDDEGDDAPKAEIASRPKREEPEDEAEDEEEAPKPSKSKKSESGGEECPHAEEGPQYKFGDFQATTTCLKKCPKKQACLAASD